MTWKIPHNSQLSSTTNAALSELKIDFFHSNVNKFEQKLPACKSSRSNTSCERQTNKQCRRCLRKSQQKTTKSFHLTLFCLSIYFLFFRFFVYLESCGKFVCTHDYSDGLFQGRLFLYFIPQEQSRELFIVFSRFSISC